MLKYHTGRPAVHHSHPEGARVARLALIINTGDAAFLTILPLQISELIGDGGPVGFYYALIALVGTLAAVASSQIFTRFRKVRIGAVSLSFMVALLLGMSAVGTLPAFAFLDIPRAAAYMFVTIVLGLLVHDFAKARNLAMEEGRFFQYSNIGWLIGPVAAGYVARYVSNEAVFGFVALVFAGALGYLIHLHLRVHPAVATESEVQSARHLWDGLREFLSHPKLRAVFALRLGLEFWWVMSAIYVPLAVVQLGFSAEVVGWVVTAGVVPLVVLEAWVGRSARQRGIGGHLLIGLVILAAGSLSFGLIDYQPELLLFAFAAINVGAALIEPLAVTAFFQVAESDETERLFGLYNAATPLSNLIGPALGATVFVIGFGLDGVWVLTGLVLAACALVVPRIGAAST